MEKKAENQSGSGVPQLTTRGPASSGEGEHGWRGWPTPYVDPVTNASTIRNPVTGDIVIAIPQNKNGGNETPRLPPITDPTDARIWEILTEDLTIKDKALGQRANVSRQVANQRRGKLKAMGYKVR